MTQERVKSVAAGSAQMPEEEAGLPDSPEET